MLLGFLVLDRSQLVLVDFLEEVEVVIKAFVLLVLEDFEEVRVLLLEVKIHLMEAQVLLKKVKVDLKEVWLDSIFLELFKVLAQVKKQVLKVVLEFKVWVLEVPHHQF